MHTCILTQRHTCSCTYRCRQTYI